MQGIILPINVQEHEIDNIMGMCSFHTSWNLRGVSLHLASSSNELLWEYEFIDGLFRVTILPEKIC